MATLSLLLLAVTALGLAAIAVLQIPPLASARRLEQRVARAREAWRIREQSQREIEQRIAMQRKAEQTIATGTEVVRTLHLGIAAIPFGILEAIPVTRHTTRVVRGVHDQISNTVYSAIGGTNRVLGSVLRQGLEGTNPPATPPAEDHDNDRDTPSPSSG